MSNLFINADDIGNVILDYIASEEFGRGIREEDRNGLITGLGIAGTLIYARCRKYIPTEEQPEPKWIPCSERLPEQGKPVLVTYIYNGKRFVAESWYIGQHDERGNPLFSSCADEYKASDLYFQKVAWMPLPEPWEGEQE